MFNFFPIKKHPSRYPVGHGFHQEIGRNDARVDAYHLIVFYDEGVGDVGACIEKEDERIRKCDISCATCSYKAILNEENEVINCDTCNKDLGFYNKNGNTNICINKTT